VIRYTNWAIRPNNRVSLIWAIEIVSYVFGMKYMKLHVYFCWVKSWYTRKETGGVSFVKSRYVSINV